MRVHVFDVEHGSCGAVEAPSGELILVDCGHNSSTGWRPSIWLVGQGREITNLTITNMDEDHVSDLPNVRRYCPIRSLSSNWHLTSSWVRDAKAEQGIGEGVAIAASLLDDYSGPPLVTDWGGLEVMRFCHPPSLFDDENSLSLVTFVRSQSIGMVFPGDLTRPAWEEFLENPFFCDCLKRTNVFVASHHGREDGCCPEVFDYCKPAIVIVSDTSMQYGTQEVNYSRYAAGVPFDNGELKKTLTTRNNGKLTLDDSYGGFRITITHY